MVKIAENKTAQSKAVNRNVIQLRNGFIFLPTGKNNNYLMAMSVVSELMQFGYILDQSAINLLKSASKEDITKFHNETITYLKYITGSAKSYRPFWKNFPEDVIGMSDAEMWMHQIVNYWTNGAYEPNEWTKERAVAFEQPKYTLLTAGDDDRFHKVFTDLVSVNQSLTPDDMEIVKWFVESNTPLIFPEQIPFKENLCTLASMGLDVPVKTVTDVLRIAVGMSGGDISLPKVPRNFIKSGRYKIATLNSERNKFKFKSFSRSERKYILGLLEKTNCDAAEATLKSQRWVKLGHSLHVGEYAKKFPKAFALFNSVRNEKVQSWYGKLTDAFSSSFEEGLNVLSQRPGEFVRKLDWLLRTETFSANKKVKGNILSKYNTKKPHIAESFKKVSLNERVNLVLDKFETIAAKASNKVLYEVYTHFEGRYQEKTGRTIMIKGARKRTTLPNLPAISAETIESVQRVIVKALMGKFASLPKFGKVYVDEELKKIPLPTNMRSMSTSLKPVIRGSRIPIGNQNSKVLRPFLHFSKNSTSMTIDLSVVMVGKNNAVCDWRTHKIGKDIVIHSGDSYGRRGDCAEYVDIDVEKALSAGFRYALIQLHNYNKSSQLNDNNHFGVMEREFPEANQTWLPSTIANCSIVTVKNITNCAIIDLDSREYIMVDEDAEKGWLNVASTLDFKAVENYIQLPKISVYDLLLMHVEARSGELVDNKEIADTKLNFEDFSMSYVNTLKYMGV